MSVGYSFLITRHVGGCIVDNQHPTSRTLTVTFNVPLAIFD